MLRSVLFAILLSPLGCMTAPNPLAQRQNIVAGPADAGIGGGQPDAQFFCNGPCCGTFGTDMGPWGGPWPFDLGPGEWVPDLGPPTSDLGPGWRPDLGRMHR